MTIRARRQGSAVPAHRSPSSSRRVRALRALLLLAVAAAVALGAVLSGTGLPALDGAASATDVEPGAAATRPAAPTSGGGSTPGAAAPAPVADGSPRSGGPSTAAVPSPAGSPAPGPGPEPVPAHPPSPKAAPAPAPVTAPVTSAPALRPGPAPEPAPPRAPLPAPAPVAAPGPEGEVLALVNAGRGVAGCGPVRADEGLAAVARAHSADMRDRDYFAHVDPDGVDPFARAHAAGVGYARAENIAAGQPDAAAVMAAWMASPGHRQNILNCELRSLGVGVATGAGGPWWTQLFGT